MRINEMLKVISLFSGIGSFEYALKKLNIEYTTMLACDIDKFCKQTYFANNDCDEWIDDVHNVDGRKYKNIDLLVGGSPCQSFSTRGKRQGFDDARGKLFFEYLRVLSETRPKVFVYENVASLIYHHKGKTYKTIYYALEKLGYNLYAKILNALDYGLPHKRPRLFIIGFLADNVDFKFPNKIQLNKCLKYYLDKNVDTKYYLSEKAINYITKPFCLDKKYTQINGEVALCQTRKQLTNLNGDFIKDEIGIRKLTPRECLRLMGFRDNFKIVCSDAQTYSQSGNAISINVLEKLFECILFMRCENESIN